MVSAICNMAAGVRKRPETFMQIAAAVFTVSTQFCSAHAHSQKQTHGMFLAQGMRAGILFTELASGHKS